MYFIYYKIRKKKKKTDKHVSKVKHSEEKRKKKTKKISERPYEEEWNEGNINNKYIQADYDHGAMCCALYTEHWALLLSNAIL